MGIIKISVFQKSMQEALNLSLYKKLAGLKSDFLVFPEFFYADSATGGDRGLLQEKGQYAMDWLQKLSDAYRGSIIGGSVYSEENGQTYLSTPVYSGGNLIDFYRKRKLSSEERENVSAGQEPGIFMLSGYRFGVLQGEESLDRAYYDELIEQDVRLIFGIRSIPATKPDDTDALTEITAANGQYVVQCCPTGTLLGERLRGRSMVLTPTGVSWRVAPHEEENEIVKTVMVNLDF